MHWPLHKLMETKLNITVKHCILKRNRPFPECSETFVKYGTIYKDVYVKMVFCNFNIYKEDFVRDYLASGRLNKKLSEKNGN